MSKTSITSDTGRTGLGKSSSPYRSSFSWYNIIDPLYWVAFYISAPILRYPLLAKEISFVHDNIHKHRRVLWMNVATMLLVWWGLRGRGKDEMNALINSLMAPAFITGGAWFAITFGGVPTKLLPLALNITLWMFAAFTIAMTTMLTSLSFILPWQLLIVFGFILFAIIVSAARYDNVDGLKVGLDDALRTHSLTHLEYLTKTLGVKPKREAAIPPG